MKTIHFIVITLMVFLIFPQRSFSQYVWPENENYAQKTVEKKSSVLRSELIGNFKKLSQNRYFLKETGKGDYNNLQDISWILESETELKDNLLSPLSPKNTFLCF